MAMGRIPDSVKHKFEEILNSPTGYAKFKRIMAATKKDEVYLAYFRECMDRKFGKAAQFVETEINDVTDYPTKLELQAMRERLNGNRPSDGVPEDNSPV